jgi:hypothetical protein
MLEKTEGQIKNGQSRNTVNIGYTKHQTKTNKTKTQHNNTISLFQIGSQENHNSEC